MTGALRRLSLGLLVAGLLTLAAACPVLGQAPRRGGATAPMQLVLPDTDYIDAIIRLEVENGPAAVIPALTYDTTLMLPVRQFFEMVEIRLEAFALRDSAVALIEPGHVRLLFRPAAQLLTRNGVRIPYDSVDVVWWDGDLFVSTPLLDRLLGVNTAVEWASLSAMVGGSSGLPVVARARRERRRELLGLRRPAPDVLDLALQRRVVDGAVATWSLTALRRGAADQASLELGFGAELLGGSAELRPLLYSGSGHADATLRWAWSRVWPESQRLRQLRVGDVQSAGLRSRLIQGVVATNAPFIRSSSFDVEQVVHDVPAGWEAELYENGRLLAYADADAIGAFRTPLQLGYGQNPFELVLYGPGGQTMRRTRTIRVPFSRLPDGRLEYAVAGGRCRFDRCDGLVSADARYGLSSHVTLQGGWDAFFDHRYGNVSQPYAVVSAAPLPELGLTGEAVVNDHWRASAHFEPTMDVRVTAAHTRFAESGARISGSFNESGRYDASVFWRPGLMSGSLILQGAAVVSNGPQLDRRLARVSASTRLGRFRYGLGILHDVMDRGGSGDTKRFAVDASADAALDGPWRWLRAASVQGQLAFEPANGLMALRTSIGRGFGRSMRLDAGLGWLRGSGYSLELAFSTALYGPRFGARSRATSAAGSEALVYSSGSIAYDPRSRVTRLSDVADLGRAGISGVVFQDDNANGLQDPGESGLADIPLRVGGWPARTDADGRFAAWGMFPSEPLQIDVDTLSFGNPQLVLPAPVLRVRPSPNAFGRVSVPVAVGAEISGFVLIGELPLAGAPLILRELNTGAEITTITFRDGGFYKGAVPPGEWEITLPQALLDRLRVSAIPLSIFVPPGAGEKRFEDLRLRLEVQP